MSPGRRRGKWTMPTKGWRKPVGVEAPFPMRGGHPPKPPARPDIFHLRSRCRDAPMAAQGIGVQAHPFPARGRAPRFSPGQGSRQSPFPPRGDAPPRQATIRRIDPAVPRTRARQVAPGRDGWPHRSPHMGAHLARRMHHACGGGRLARPGLPWTGITRARGVSGPARRLQRTAGTCPRRAARRIARIRRPRERRHGGTVSGGRAQVIAPAACWRNAPGEAPTWREKKRLKYAGSSKPTAWPTSATPCSV